MLIDHEGSRALAREHMERGLELAFQANRMRNLQMAAREEHAQRCAPTDEPREPLAYLALQNSGIPERAGLAASYRTLQQAAGAFIGIYTLGGDLLAAQTGGRPLLDDGGSYTPF